MQVDVSEKISLLTNRMSTGENKKKQISAKYQTSKPHNAMAT